MPLPAPAADRACLVTGASSGIGADIARELAARGYQLVLVARSEVPLQRLADEIGTDQVPVHVLPTDLSDRAERAALLDRVARLGLAVDVLVNNAGYSTLGRVAEADPADEMAMTEVDVVAVQDLCTRVLPSMLERGSGAILNVASTAAFQPLPGQASYAAAKSFVLSYTLSLAGELAGTGVTATCLCPGPVKTGFADRAGFDPDDFDSSLPRMMWLSSEQVARHAVKELDKGSLVAIPGLANQLGARFSQVAPRRLLLGILRRAHPALK